MIWQVLNGRNHIIGTSKVYFADFRAPTWRETLPQKLARLVMTAGFDDINLDGKYVAIKMHFGEPGNLAYLRPNWANVVVDLVKDKGGKPFLTDCNTLYIGGRKNALDQACADAVVAQRPVAGSMLNDCDLSGCDLLTAAHPDTQWQVCMEHGEKLGLGCRKYELVKI